MSLGPRAEALAADLKHRLGIPYRKIADLFQTAFGLEVTVGKLCQADEQLAELGRAGLPGVGGSDPLLGGGLC